MNSDSSRGGMDFPSLLTPQDSWINGLLSARCLSLSLLDGEKKTLPFSICSLTSGLVMVEYLMVWFGFVLFFSDFTHFTLPGPLKLDDVGSSAQRDASNVLAPTPSLTCLTHHLWTKRLDKSDVFFHLGKNCSSWLFQMHPGHLMVMFSG